MDRSAEGPWAEGAWPSRGAIGPREGLPPGVVWPSRRDRTGATGPTHWQTRNGSWRRVGTDLWVPSETEPSTAQRIVEVAAGLPVDGVITGWAALHWAGARWFTGEGPQGERPVPVVTGVEHTFRRRPGITVSQEDLQAYGMTRHRGLQTTVLARSVAYEMRKAVTDEQALVAFEMAAYDDLLSIAELQAFTTLRLPRRQGVGRIRKLLPLLEENSWSPIEPVMRLTWVNAGFPRPLANRPVFDLDGRFLGTPDLIDPTTGVVGEYDGALHLAGEQRHADVARDARYRGVGLEPVTMLAGDLRDRAGFLSRLSQAYARARRTPSSAWAWTLTAPPGWTRTHTVDLRRALTSSQRTRLLRYRRAA